MADAQPAVAKTEEELEAEVAALLAGTKKKKKEKKEKKKKDKKKKDKKKNKKKNNNSNSDDEAAAGAGAGDVEGESKQDAGDAAGAAGGGAAAGASDVFSEAPKETYQYQLLLTRAFEILKRNNPDFAKKKRYVMAPPQVYRVGSTRTCWSNFATICGQMNRTPDHVLSFFLVSACVCACVRACALVGSFLVCGRLSYVFGQTCVLARTRSVRCALTAYFPLRATLTNHQPTHTHAHVHAQRIRKCTCAQAELGNEGSIDGSQRLMLRGRFVPKKIESLLRKYIVEYVTCEMCRSPNTELTRDPVSRLNFVNCKSCSASRAVSSIRAGFQALRRGQRRRERR